jgi:hypothetical protein
MIRPRNISLASNHHLVNNRHSKSLRNERRATVSVLAAYYRECRGLHRGRVRRRRAHGPNNSGDALSGPLVVDWFLGNRSCVRHWGRAIRRASRQGVRRLIGRRPGPPDYLLGCREARSCRLNVSDGHHGACWLIAWVACEIGATDRGRDHSDALAGDA